MKTRKAIKNRKRKPRHPAPSRNKEERWENMHGGKLVEIYRPAVGRVTRVCVILKCSRESVHEEVLCLQKEIDCDWGM